jgi:hypothetical protein
MLGAIAVAALAGGAGAAVGATLARLVGRTHARHLAEHLGRGGLLLWVRTHDARHEEIALDLLKRHGGDHVHLHVLPPAGAGALSARIARACGSAARRAPRCGACHR